jgi:hypothetical protein
MNTSKKTFANSVINHENIFLIFLTRFFQRASLHPGFLPPASKSRSLDNVTFGIFGSTSDAKNDAKNDAKMVGISEPTMINVTKEPSLV